MAAVLSMPRSPRRMADLGPGDRAMVVAGLELAGETAERSAERMDCSLRQIRLLRGEDITQMAKLLQTETARLEDEVRQGRCEHGVTRQALAEAQRENERLRMQLDQILDAHVTGTLKTFPGCGHPMVPYNTYEHGSRKWCRDCGRTRKAARRRLIAVS